MMDNPLARRNDGGGGGDDDMASTLPHRAAWKWSRWMWRRRQKGELLESFLNSDI